MRCDATQRDILSSQRIDEPVANGVAVSNAAGVAAGVDVVVRRAAAELLLI